MKALIVREFGGPDRLEVVDLPLPEPGPHQVRIRVAASAVNPIDLSTRNGALAGAGLLGDAVEVSLGWDVSGTVDAVGVGVSRIALGDRVIGLRDILSAMPGGQAECVLLEEGAVAPAPKSATMVEAATLPLNGLTADRSLALADVRAGQTLLVTGAAGAVGGFALQLASLRGARTIAVASEADRELVTELGADEFVPRGEPLAEAVRLLVPGGVDAVIDAALLGIAAHEALRGEGTFVALVRPFAPPPIRGTRVLVQEVFADGPRLAELAALVDAGLLTLRVAEAFPLAEASRAHTRAEEGGVRGKIVLVP
jgi:NADPH:quinone reductase-like Zn-dependent oxidoreductase